MQYDDITNQVKAELKNKRANDRLLERMAEQIKIVKKAEDNVKRQKQKLDKLIQEKNNLTSASIAEASQEE